MNGRATTNETAGVVVYSTPNCAQCGLTYQVMDSKGIDYTIVDLSTNKAAVENVTEDLGYSQAPVVVASDKNHWSGIRPDNIKQPAASSQQPAAGSEVDTRAPHAYLARHYRRWGAVWARAFQVASRLEDSTAMQSAAGKSQPASRFPTIASLTILDTLSRDNQSPST